MKTARKGTSPTTGTETPTDAEAKAEAIKKIRKAANLLKDKSQGGRNLHKMRSSRVALYFPNLNGSAKRVGSKDFLRGLLAEEGASFLFINSRIDDLGGLRIFVGCGQSAVAQNALLEAELLAQGILKVTEEDVAPQEADIMETRGLVELPGGGFGTLHEYRQALMGADSPAQQ